MVFDAAWKACSAAFSAQLTEPASVVRLQPFLRESSLLVVPEDVHELEHDPAAIRRKGLTGERVNSRTKVPVIVVWHAAKSPSTTMIPP